MSARRFLAPVAALALLLAGCTHKAQTEASAQLAYHRGYEALAAGDWLKAQQYLLQARDAFPDDPFVVLNLGVIAQQLGKFDEARGYYQQVIDMKSDEVPRQVSQQEEAGKTVSDLARDDMATLPKQ